MTSTSPFPSLHDGLPPVLRSWVAEQAERMGLPGPDDYILLLLRLEKQRLDLEQFRPQFLAACLSESAPPFVQLPDAEPRP